MNTISMKGSVPFSIFNLVESRVENDHTRSLVFDAPLPGAQPGQFVMAWLPGVGEKPYSVTDDAPFSLLVTEVGPFSAALCALQPGARLWVRGPLGNGFQLVGQRCLLAGGGCGAAPLLFLAKRARAADMQVEVCLGVRGAQDMLLENAFISSGCTLTLASEDGSRGVKGDVVHALAQRLQFFQPETLYACGPMPMLMALVDFCREQHMPAQFSWEALMRCGIGLCGACEMDEETCRKAGLPPGWLTCKDGPVSMHPLT